jgi:hypothetical protein
LTLDALHFARIKELICAFSLDFLESADAELTSLTALVSNDAFLHRLFFG